MLFTLKSDFRDYYDHQFDIIPPGFNEEEEVVQFFRTSQGGLPKDEQLGLLYSAGFNVPKYGLVKDLVQSYRPDYVVVYTDLYAHQGQGKILYPVYKALQEKPDALATVFIPTSYDELVHAKSIRYLFIGNRVYTLDYEGIGSWMSNNAGETRITLRSPDFTNRDYFGYELGLDLDLDNFSRYPLFAVDCVKHYATGEEYAIDFNSAPGLKGTPIEDLVPSREIVDALIAFTTSNPHSFYGR